MEGSSCLPRVGGWGTTEWVRLDESYMGYDKTTKIWKLHKKYRILGLDQAGNYYQAVFEGANAESWRNIDFALPHESNCSELIYPQYKGYTLKFIPFTVCNVNKIGYNNWQYPPFLDVAYTAIGIYQVDSIYKKALWNHATPTLTVCNIDAKEDDSNAVFIGDALFLNSNSNYPASASLLETSGAGLQEMRASKNEMKSSLKYSSLRDLLDDAGSNSSGSAIQLRTTSGTACISSIDNAGALAIEEQLIYASIWSGANPEEAGERIIYRANTSYLNAEDQLQSIVSLFNANEQTADGRPILSRRNKFNILKNRFPFGISSYEDNEAQIDDDQDRLGIDSENEFPMSESPQNIDHNKIDNASTNETVQKQDEEKKDAPDEKTEESPPKDESQTKEEDHPKEENVDTADENGSNKQKKKKNRKSRKNK